MGSELVSDSSPLDDGGESEQSDFAPKSLYDTFCEHLPYYLSIGMTYEQYWLGSVDLVRYYHKAQKMKEQRINEQLWLQGKYFYDALCAASPAFRALSKRGPYPYIEKPYSITTEQTREEKQKKTEKAKAFMDVWAINVNKQFADKEVSNDGG